VIAVDTNVIVRLLTGDEAKQARRAQQLFERETIFLPKTVLLEAEWVLRRLYGFAPRRVIDAFGNLIALPNVRCEDVSAVGVALEWGRRGIDFADALHVASSRDAADFASFDGALLRRGRRIAGMNLVPV